MVWRLNNIHVWIFQNPLCQMKSDTLKAWKYFFQNESISSWLHHKIHAKQIKFSVTAISEGGNLILTTYTPIRWKDILEENNITCPKHNYISPTENILWEDHNLCLKNFKINNIQSLNVPFSFYKFIPFI